MTDGRSTTLRGPDSLTAMARAILWAVPLAVAASSCFFDLPPLAEGVGGAGGVGGTGTGAGVSSTSSSAGGSAQIYALPVSYPSGAVSSPITDVPVPVFLDAFRMDYGRAAPDGADVRAFDDQGQPLPMEVEVWDPDGASLVWVRLPTMATEGGAFSLRFGDPNAPAGPPATEVWSGFNAVYHFADADPNSTVRDTLGVSDGAGSNVTPISTPIGRGVAFDGLTSLVDVSNDDNWDIPAGEIRTMSVWFRRQITDPNEMPMRSMTPMSNRASGPSCQGWWLSIFGDPFANTNIRFNTDDCNSTYLVVSNGGLGDYGDSNWHRFDAVVDRQTGIITIYTDGTVRANESFPGLTSGIASGDLAQFGAGPPGDERRFEGDIDEARIRVGRPTDAWLETTYTLEQDDILVFGPVAEVP